MQLWCYSLDEGALKSAKQLLALIDVINQTVGDALSDLLLVETVLHANGWSVADWDAAYVDLPNRQMKVRQLCTGENYKTFSFEFRVCFFFTEMMYKKETGIVIVLRFPRSVPLWSFFFFQSTNNFFKFLLLKCAGLRSRSQCYSNCWRGEALRWATWTATGNWRHCFWISQRTFFC